MRKLLLGAAIAMLVIAVGIGGYLIGSRRPPGPTETANYEQEAGSPEVGVPRYAWTAVDGTTLSDTDVAWWRCEHISTTNIMSCDVMYVEDGEISPGGFQEALDTGVLDGAWVDPSTCYLTNEATDLECRIHWAGQDVAMPSDTATTTEQVLDGLSDADRSAWAMDNCTDGIAAAGYVAVEGVCPEDF